MVADQKLKEQEEIAKKNALIPKAFLYEARLVATGTDYEVNMYEKPCFDSKRIAQCSTRSIAYVLDDSVPSVVPGEILFKVSVDGRLGYIGKNHIRKK